MTLRPRVERGTPRYDDWLRRQRIKKRRQRAFAKARRAGFTEPPPWMWFGHEPGCACFDCLWGDLPWREDGEPVARARRVK